MDPLHIPTSFKKHVRCISTSSSHSCCQWPHCSSSIPQEELHFLFGILLNWELASTARNYSPFSSFVGLNRESKGLQGPEHVVDILTIQQIIDHCRSLIKGKGALLVNNNN